LAQVGGEDLGRALGRANDLWDTKCGTGRCRLVHVLLSSAADVCTASAGLGTGPVVAVLTRAKANRYSEAVTSRWRGSTSSPGGNSTRERLRRESAGFYLRPTSGIERRRRIPLASQGRASHGVLSSRCHWPSVVEQASGAQAEMVSLMTGAWQAMLSFA